MNSITIVIPDWALIAAVIMSVISVSVQIWLAVVQKDLRKATEEGIAVDTKLTMQLEMLDLLKKAKETSQA